MSSSQENLCPQVIQKIARELRKLSTTPLDGIQIVVNEENITDIQADIQGPVGTPYENGIFRCKLVLSNNFPASPPRGFFLTKIFHPNVAPNGDICVNTLKRDWSEELGMGHIFQVIRCLLIVPFPESALNEDASKLFLGSYDEYFRRAKLMTSIHATKKYSETTTKSSSDIRGELDDDSNVSNADTGNTPVSGNPSKRVAITKDAVKLDKKKNDRKRDLKRL